MQVNKDRCTLTMMTITTTTVFILHHATAYHNSASRCRSSVPLNEIALQQLHMHHYPFQVQLQIAINFPLNLFPLQSTLQMWQKYVQQVIMLDMSNILGFMSRTCWLGAQFP